MTGASHSILLTGTPNLYLLLGAPHPVPIPATGLPSHTHTQYWDPNLYLYPLLGPLSVPLPFTGTLAHTCIHYRGPCLYPYPLPGPRPYPCA